MSPSRTRGGPGKWQLEAARSPSERDRNTVPNRLEPDEQSFRNRAERRRMVIVGGDRLTRASQSAAGDSLHLYCSGPVPLDHADRAEDGRARLRYRRQRRLRRPQLRPMLTRPLGYTARANAGKTSRRPCVCRGDWRALIAAGHYAEGVHAARRGRMKPMLDANAVDCWRLRMPPAFPISCRARSTRC